MKVITERLGGGEPDMSLYAVAEEIPSKAVEIVRTGAGLVDEKAEAVGPIRWDVLTDKFGLKEGEFTHL